MADQRTMAQLLQAPTEGYEDAIVIPAITADNFELKHGLLTLVQNKQFHGHDKEDPHAYIRYFNKITSTLKSPNVPNTSIKLMLFPFSLEGAARIWLEKEPPRSILTWDDLVSKFINQFFPPSKTTSLRNEITNFQQRFDESFNQDSLNYAVGGNFLDKMTRDFLSIIESKSKVRYSRDKPVVAKAPAYQAPAPQTQGVSKEDFSAYVKANDAVMRNMQTQGQNMQNQLTNLTDLIMKFVNSNTASTSSSGTLPSNTIANPKSNLKAITTQSGVSYDGPQILPPVVENEPEATKDTVNPTNNGNTEDVQPQAIQSKAVTFEPAIAPVSASKPNPKALIPYPSRRNDEKNREKANNQIEKFYQIFKDMSFEISFVDSLILMPKFASTLKALIGNKEKLSEMSRTPLNEHCLAVLLKKLPEKLGDPCKFLIPCDFPELADRSISHPVRVAEDVYIKAITFNLDQTSRYYANYSDMTVKRIDVIDMACEEYSQEVLGFFDTISSGNPTLFYDPIISATSPTLTPFGNSDFLVEEELKIYEAKTHKSPVDEPSVVELKALPPHLEYAFLEGDEKLPVIIAKDLSVEEKTALITVLKSHKRAIAWKLSDIKGINPEFCTHKILMEEDFTPAVQHQRRVNPKIHDVIKQKDNELILTHLITGWRVCIDYRKFNEATRKDHFPLSFMDQMLERLARNQYYCFLNGFSGYFQIPINPKDQEKTTFTYPYGKFAYRRMPFRLCNSPGMFQRCMIAIFHDMIEKTMEVFMDDFSIFGNSFQYCLSHLEKMRKRFEDTNLCLNWEKGHFMVKEGIVLGHKIFKQGIEVDKAKVDVISKLPHSKTVKGIRSFLGHAGFYRCFIKEFSKIARPMTRLLEKDTLFIFSQECVDAFQTLKRKLTEAPILIALNWNMPFELMCDASDFAIGEVLGQCQDKHFRPIHYASKTMTEAESNYTMTEKE
nr:reverse transcriptase domain-containing protein [Tanacetum cinerariifolium]